MACIRRVCWSARTPVLADAYPMLWLRRDPLKLVGVHERRPPPGAVPDRGDSRLRPCVGSPARISRFILFHVQAEADRAFCPVRRQGEPQELGPGLLDLVKLAGNGLDTLGHCF